MPVETQVNLVHLYIDASTPSTPRETNSVAGRRSRRSSISDESQLTLENFGGFQDRLHFAGKNPEKELATLATARKISATSGGELSWLNWWRELRVTILVRNLILFTVKSKTHKSGSGKQMFATGSLCDIVIGFTKITNNPP